MRAQHLALPLGELLRPAIERCPSRLIRYFETTTWRPVKGLTGEDLAPLFGSDDVALRELGLRLAAGVGSGVEGEAHPRVVTQ